MRTGINVTTMFDNLYIYFPLVGFFVYLKPRYRLETFFLLGTGLIIFWLMNACGFRSPSFVHLSAILIEVLYVIFILHVVVGKSRAFIMDVPFCVWISGVTMVTAFAISVTAYVYITGLAE